MTKKLLEKVLVKKVGEVVWDKETKTWIVPELQVIDGEVVFCKAV